MCNTLPKAKEMPVAVILPGAKFVSPESIASGLPLKGGFFIVLCALVLRDTSVLGSLLKAGFPFRVWKC